MLQEKEGDTLVLCFLQVHVKRTLNIFVVDTTGLDHIVFITSAGFVLAARYSS